MQAYSFHFHGRRYRHSLSIKEGLNIIRDMMGLQFNVSTPREGTAFGAYICNNRYYITYKEIWGGMWSISITDMNVVRYYNGKPVK
jgi:hypothetical protein